MKEKSIYIQVKEKSLPFIKHYHADLLKHDRRTLSDKINKGMAFLHFTGDTGTYLCLFNPSKNYPGPGERIRYCFGTANRHEILEQVPGVIENMRTLNRQKLILYFDGYSLNKITQGKAEHLATQYVNDMKDAWTGIKNKYTA